MVFISRADREPLWTGQEVEGGDQISSGQDGGVCECGIRRETARWHQRAQEDVDEKEERDSKWDSEESGQRVVGGQLRGSLSLLHQQQASVFHSKLWLKGLAEHTQAPTNTALRAIRAGRGLY